MKSYWIRPESGKTVVELRDAPVPEPGPGRITTRETARVSDRGLAGSVRTLDAVQAGLGMTGSDPVAVFTELRERKNKM